MKILVIGTGYVGLVTGVCFAEMGHHVTCLDIDKEKIRQLQDGHVPIYEPGLSEFISRNVHAKRLFFTTDYQTVKENDVCFIAVATPQRDDGSCNTTYIEKAARDIGKNIEKHTLIVNKSTAPVGTCFQIKDSISEELQNRKSDVTFDIVSNPEFLKEGSAISDCMKPDRIVIGCDNDKSKEWMRKIYAPFMFHHEKMLFMDILSAEMTKYAANAMLATRISFMNEIAQLCTLTGANISEVRKGIGSDPRIGYSFLYAGIGYGGSCFPKDVNALVSIGKEHGYTPSLLVEVDRINERQKQSLADKIERYFLQKGGIKGKKIAVWGLAFKPDTDDVREAPALTFIDQMQRKGAILKLYDPIAMDNAKKTLKDQTNIIWCDDKLEAAKETDAIALLTEWKQFRIIDFKPIIAVMNSPVFFDGRNQYHPKEMNENGFQYFGIGIPTKMI
jgi:UDPglucose 6-dehydrogenase